jgi:hypothetical protein
MRLVAAIAAACAVAGGGVCEAQEPRLAEPAPHFAPVVADSPHSIFVFAGALADGDLGDALLLVDNNYSGSFIGGAAYRYDFLRLPFDFSLGAEVGIAGRFGHGESAEFWGAAALRYRNLWLGSLNLIPAVMFGLSAVTGPTGIEHVNVAIHHGNEKLLFYLGFELAFALPDYSGWELVYRVHHRSGGYGTLGDLREGNNANVLGFRHYF